MTKQMKFIIFFFLLFFSEVYSLEHQIKTQHQAKTQFQLKARRAQNFKKVRKALVSIPKNPLVESIQKKFNSLGADLENSKWFNFLVGATIKSISLLEGNPILDITKCAVSGVEVFYNAHKFPAKSLKELQDMSSADDKAAAAALAETDKAADISEEDHKMLSEMSESEKDARILECKANKELMKEKDGLDYMDDVETEETKTNEEITEQQAKLGVKAQFLQVETLTDEQFNPKKLFKKLKAQFKSLKEKFSKLAELFKEKLLKLEKIIKKWLDKPIVKALISFMECSLPSILTLIIKGGASFLTAVTGMSVINIVKQGPKFLKMIIDSVKSLRSGFMKKAIKDKYQEYGKGTASLVMVVILSITGSS